MPEVIVPKIKRASIERDGIDVVVVMNGRRVLDVPWDAALQLARAITIQARRIEEQVKALRIIDDQALLIRTGAPFGITNHPALMKEAKKEAANNDKLRKYIPHVSDSIRSKEAVGTPTIIQHKPKEGQ